MFANRTRSRQAGDYLPLAAMLVHRSNNGNLQNVAEFWLALGGRARGAFDYTVTLAGQVAEPVKPGPARDDGEWTCSWE